MPFHRNHIRHAARPDAHPSSMIRTEPDIDTESYHFLVFRLFPLYTASRSFSSPWRSSTQAHAHTPNTRHDL